MKKLLDLKLSKLKQFKRVIIQKGGYFKDNSVFMMALFIYTFFAILFFNYYQYIVTIDGIFYISIAHAYALHDFSNAINGYWSPLLSWLLSPSLFFGSSNIYLLHSAKILSIIIGFFTMIGVKFLFSKFIMDKKLVNIVLFASIPLLLYYVFSYVSPDLLLVCILLFYFGLIFDPKYSSRLRYGIVCGFLGALAYFSKTYAFIFFIFHFILFNLIFYFHEVDKERKDKVKKNLILGLIVFLALSGIWASIISDKFGEITIGTSGIINFASIGPGNPGTEINYQGLVIPKNKNPVSAFEDPSYSKVTSWNPIGTVKSFIFYLNIVCNNIIKTATIFLSFSILSLFILLVAIIWILKHKKEEISRRLMYLLITILIYTGGYCLIFVDSRYLWVVSILILLLGIYLFEIFNKNGIIKSKIKNILLAVLIFSFIIMPVIGLFSLATEPLGNGLHNIGYTLKDDYNVHGNIASNYDFIDSFVITYYLNSTYYGEPKKGINMNELKTELKNNNIDYYLVWETSNQTDLPYKKIDTMWEFNVNGTIWYLKIYSLKNNSK